MISSNYNPWPINGATRVILRVVCGLVILFYLIAYPFGVSDFWDYSQFGRIGIQYSQLPDGTIAVIAIAPGGPAEQAGVRPGDRIIQIDGFVIKPETTEQEILNRVGGTVGQPVSLLLQTSDNQEKRVTVMRIKFPSDLVNIWLSIIQMVVFSICALVIFWKMRRSGYALLVSLGLVTFGSAISGVWVDQPGLEMFLFYGLGFILMLFVLLIFPGGRFAPVWTFVIGILGVFLYGLSLFPAPLNPYEWHWKYLWIAQAILFGTALVVQIINYHRSATTDEKMRMRIAFWGAISAIFVFFLFNILYNLMSVYSWLYLHPSIQIGLNIVYFVGLILLPILLTFSMSINGQADQGENIAEPEGI